MSDKTELDCAAGVYALSIVWLPWIGGSPINKWGYFYIEAFVFSFNHASKRFNGI